jgi:hypothetical protein
MVTNEELDVLHAHDTGSLMSLLEQKECFVRYSTKCGLHGEWVADDERVSIIKSELARRGVFEWA